MNDFKNYTPENGENNSGGNSNQMNNTVELAKVLSRAMNGKSEGQLLQKIIAEAERGKRQHQHFDSQRKDDIFHNYAVGLPRYINGGADMIYIIVHKYDIRRFYCRVAAKSSHGYPDVRSGK